MPEIVAGRNAVVSEAVAGTLKVGSLQQKEFAFWGPVAQRMPVLVPMVIDTPQVFYDGASAPTYTVGKASTFTGAVTNLASFPAQLSAGEFLVVNVTAFADATQVWIAMSLVEL